LADDYAIEVEVGPSAQEIPFPYVIDASSGLGTLSPPDLAKHFPTTELALIGDELADGIELSNPDQTIPLALFDGLRTDFSLARLAHYTGTRIEDFQRFILFTNYHRYVDEFVDWAGQQLGQDGYTSLTGAGGIAAGCSQRQCARIAVRHRVAAPPDASLSPHPAGQERDHAGQHRGRPVQRQDDLRSPCGAAARSLADDRPLRRPA
jgi:hypothetical protein